MRRILSAALSPLVRCSFAFLCLVPAIAAAQEPGTVTGTVTRAGEGSGAEQRVRVGRGHRTEHGHGHRREVHAPARPGGPAADRLPLAGVSADPGGCDRRGGRDRDGRRRARAGHDLAERDRGGGRLARARADRGGARGDLGGAARGASGCLDHRPGAHGAPGGARRRRGAERRQRLQRQRPRLQLLAQPAGAGPPGRPGPRDRVPRLAGVERPDPAARGPGQGRDGPRPGLGALRRQRLQRRHQHHHARRRARRSAPR